MPCNPQLGCDGALQIGRKGRKFSLSMFRIYGYHQGAPSRAHLLAAYAQQLRQMCKAFCVGRSLTQCCSVDLQIFFCRSPFPLGE